MSSENAHIATIPTNEIIAEFIPNREQNVQLLIKNIIPQCVAFKIMTTNPKCYLVNPNQGIIDSTCILEVDVTMKPGRTPPETQHKFMIKTVTTTLTTHAAESEIL